jgi:hypothetical protein
MAGTKKMTGFGLRDVAVAARPTAPATTPVWKDIPLVESAMFKLDVKEAELWGDDRYAGTFYHSVQGKLSVKSNMIALDVFELITGTPVDTSVPGTEKMYFGTDEETLPPRLIVRGIIPTRNLDGTVGTLTVYFFNTEVKTPYENLPGSERAKIMETQLQFNCFSSEQDEKGDTLTGGVTTAFGRIDVS